MSLLGNHNNDFEKQLKKQLNDTEYKPSESLWDRIDKDVNRPVFEQKVGSKLHQYQVTPSEETWEQIEAQLPPEPNRWKPIGKLWYGLFFLLFSGGLTIGYFITKQQQEAKIAQAGEVVQQQPEKPKSASNNQALTANEPVAIKPVRKQIITTKNVKSLPSNSAYEAGNKPASFIADTKKQLPKQPNSSLVVSQKQRLSAQPVNPGSLQTEPVTENSPEQGLPTQIAPADKPTLPINANKSILDHSSNSGLTQQATSVDKALSPVLPASKNNALASDSSTTPVASINKPAVILDSTNKPSGKTIAPTEATNKVILPIDSTAKIAAVKQPKVISISILAGVHMSNMVLKGPSGRDMSSNINLRKQAEQAKSEITAGFLLDYHLNNKWLVSSGIFITNFKMEMSYNTLPANQSAQKEPGASYIHANDSIFNGSRESQGVRYSWNEIPLLVTYRINPAKRLNFELKTGLSYAIINTVDANIIGYNNVGVLVVKGKEAFPQMGNSVFAHAYAGINYRLNESVSINVMPYLRYSLNSMVKNENWVQQHPYLTGLSLSLRKQF